MNSPQQSGDKKQRWSRAQKQESQRAPARRPDGPPSRSSERGANRSFGNRDERPSYNNRDDRGARPSTGGPDDRGSRPSYNNRDDRSAPRSYGNRDERPSYGNRDDRGGRPSTGGRDDRGSRPSYNNRDDRSAPRSYGNRDERPSYGNRDDRGGRPSTGGRDARGSRPSYNNRDDRSAPRSYGNRDERPSYGNRDDRGARPSTSGRDDRGGRPSTGGRDDRGSRPSYNNRDERPSYNNRDDRGARPSTGGRDDRGSRPSYNNRDERPSYGNRDDRGGRPSTGGRDDRGSRPSYNNRDERPSYGNRDDRGARPSTGGRDDRGSRPSYNNRDERPSYGNRDDRGGRPTTGGRDDRGSRPSYNNRDERPSYGNRDDRSASRPAYNRDDRPKREDRAERPRTEDRTYPRTDTGAEPKADLPVNQQAATLESPNPAPENEAEAIASDVVTSQNPASDVSGFAELGLPEVLVKRMARDGITAPFPIQSATIPDALAGRDVLGRGRTGSGKTLAFGLPTLTRLAQGGKARPACPRALVLVPTRELAMQVADALQPLVHAIGLHHKLVAGGMPYEPQLQALARGVDLLIATPGRLMDLIERGAADLSRVEIAILDEADHMAEMGFLEDITKILDDVPAGGQRLLFSATLDRGIDTVVDRYLVDPVTHSTDDGTVSISTMSHHALLIEPRDKKIVTAEVANREGRTVVFSRTKLGADRIASELREQGVLAAALHGGLNQGQRNKVLSAFKDGRIPVLVATDVAARGIHVDDVGVVLQVDPPADHKDYLHRAGRTARAGEAGTVVTLALPHQRKAVTRLLEQAGVESGLQRARPGDEVIRAAGGRTPQERSISDQDLHRILTPRREAGRGGGGGGGQRRGGRPGGSYRGGQGGQGGGQGGGGGRRSEGGYRGEGGGHRGRPRV